MTIPTWIEEEFKKAFQSARATALYHLENHGLRVGTLIEELDFRGKPTGRFYRVTSIGSDGRPNLWLHGQKLRHNGTFGEHHHSITSPERARVVDPSELGLAPADMTAF